MNNEIPKRLQPFFDTIEPLPYKNHGGCLFFAYVFWLWAKKNNIGLSTFDIVQIDGGYNSVDIEVNLNWISNQGRCGDVASSYHFGWRLNNRYYDSEGRAYPNESHMWCDPTILKGLNTPTVCLVETFCEKALTEAGWNKTFDRLNAIGYCQDAFGIDLREVSYLPW